MIGDYTLRLNLKNKKALESKLVKNKELMKSYDIQIDYQREKEMEVLKRKKELEQTENKLDYQKLKIKSMKGDDSLISNKKAETRKEKIKEIKLGELIEKVNSGLHENKHLTLTTHLHIQEALKKIESKMIKMSSYIDLFKECEKEAHKLLIHKAQKEIIRDFRTIMTKLSDQQEILDVINKLFDHLENII